MPTPRLLALFSMILLAACASESQSTVARATAPLEATVRDSAGVSIYEHDADALQRMPLITMDPTPAAVIGGEALADDVTRLRELIVMRDGRVAGWDGGTGAIRIFGTDGTEVAAFGRKGEGPGEFRTVDRLVLGSGDTLLASDWILSRISLITPEDGVVGAYAAPLRGSRQHFTLAGVVGDDRWLLVPGVERLLFQSGIDPDATAPIFPSGTFGREESRENFDTILVERGEPMVQYTMRHRGKDEAGEGNGRYTRFPIADGWDRNLAALDNRSWSVGRYDAGGTLRAIYRVNTPLVAVTDSLKDAVNASLLELSRRWYKRNPSSNGESIEDDEFNLQQMPWPDSLPPFVRSIPATGQLLWLEETSTDPSLPGTEVAIAPDGRLMGRFLVPADVRLVSFGTDAVILRTEDDDGIIRFEVHRLRFPGADGSGGS